MASIFYRISDEYGNPPMPGGGWVVGVRGDTPEDLYRYLAKLYGPRLMYAVDAKTGKKFFEREQTHA